MQDEEDIFTQVGVREDRMGGRNGLGAARGKRAVAQVKNLAQFALELNPIEQARITASGKDCWGQEVSVFARAFAVLGIIPGLGQGTGAVNQSLRLSKVAFAKGKWLIHFEKHGVKVGAFNSVDYLQKARNLVERLGVLSHKTKSGDYYFYDPCSNEFASVAADGLTLRTYFKPDRGVAYWQDQLRK